MTLLAIILMVAFTKNVHAQEHEVQVLILDWQKLEQMKKTVKNLKEGYTIVRNGYLKIKGIADGDLELHTVFIDALSDANPVVKEYYKVGEIIEMQIDLIKITKDLNEYVLLDTNYFSSNEIDDTKNITNLVVDYSIKNLDDLIMVLTVSSAEMSTDERLVIIDKIHADLLNYVQAVNYYYSDARNINRVRNQKSKDLQFEKAINE